ncbi:MAG TPA: (2Fe-2S)-binding protein [Alteromonas sp.]|jgi:phenylpropionate dioxygenase-like ring-hydroxylating dioxygenase large terminal subunit|uniref:aromatic ring-hydroxylating oxygenase subunit alpha n=1 Tax=Marisediminitalea sp. TaxID=2662268 RepID=UPI000C8D7B0E|nr:(2Fe-2S)-binding protein [Alteromonadaceae bacterium]BBO25740.1 (2Fe-2S)-binding protein [Alteromonas sp. I4]HBY40370.1 (2Fe-2S)-binding protein [Alteromonas sp.]|tara:strand:- start:1991 stop:3181 length:1191 start_codon:yes stop_codon:yes gene_type:complete
MSPFFLNDEFFDSLESSIQEIEHANTLPPLCYTDAGFFDFEKRALFDHEWLCVGRVDWLPNPGDFYTTTVVNEPIVVVHDRDGTIRAMSSVCQHRAMLVAEGAGNTRTFTCPYHHWVYNLKGDLINAPAMEKTCNFHKETSGLPNFKLEIWHGFIFINFDDDAKPLAPRLTALEPILANYEIASAEGPAPDRDIQYPFSWKVMFENNNDGYHANRLHQGEFHDYIPSELAEFPEFLPEETAGFYRTNGTLHKDASFNPTQKALMPVFPKLNDEERNRMAFANLPPSLSLVLTCDAVIYLILRADGPESHQLDLGVLFAKGAMDDPEFDKKMEMVVERALDINAQDIHVDELVQKGLRSRYAPRGRYSWQEGAQRQFNTWLVPRYRAQWEQMKRKSQ